MTDTRPPASRSGLPPVGGGPAEAGNDAAVDGDIGYTDALDELEAILDELDGDEVDVDVLGARVRRAAELLRLCRARIAGARFEVEQVVSELEAEADAAGAVAGGLAAGGAATGSPETSGADIDDIDAADAEDDAADDDGGGPGDDPDDELGIGNPLDTES